MRRALETFVGLSHLRHDAAFIARLQREERLLEIALACVLTIVLGAGSYGAVFGIWRAPEAALYAAIKLPAVFLGVALLTSLASAILAPLLRAKLSSGQTFVCILISFAVTSAILGALAPIALLFVECAPRMDAFCLGLDSSDPRIAPSLAVARTLVLMHTFVIAMAGIAGVLRLLALLERLGDPALVVRRVVVSWLALQFLVGAQISWVLRPFLGRPHEPTRFLMPDAFAGSFFEEVSVLAYSTFGPATPQIGILFVVLVIAWLVTALRTPRLTSSVEALPHGLLVHGLPPRLIAWARVIGIEANVLHHGSVSLRVAADESLVEEELHLTCADAESARVLASSLQAARDRSQVGPFRTLSV
jgi:hypothetical protein